jgi:hypothetical protein
MKFYFQKISEKDSYRARLLSDENEEFFYLQVPKDNVDFWLIGFLKMMELDGRCQQCQRLVRQVYRLHDCDEENLPPTFYRILLALLRFLERPESELLDTRQNAQQVIRQLLKQNKKFNFRAAYENDTYSYGLIVNGNTFSFTHSEDAGLIGVPQSWWSHAISELYRQDTVNLREVLVNYQLLREVVLQQSMLSDRPETVDFTWHSFANFLKALIEFLDQSNDFLTLRGKITDLCMFIVENEHDSFEEQKRYLQRILISEEALNIKIERLINIVWDVQEDARRDPTGNQMRLTAIIGSISDHYLSQYDLDQAAYFWEPLKDRDWLLRSILSFYRWPGRYAIGILVFIGLASFVIISDLFPVGITFTNLTIVNGPFLAGTTIHSILAWLSMALVLLAFVPALIALGTVLWRFLTQRGLEYVELFLPRLLGAIVVGLSILLLQDTAWNIGLHLDALNLTLVCLAVYTLSFAYIFIDVHKTLRRIYLPPMKVIVRSSADQTRRPIVIKSKTFSNRLFQSYDQKANPMNRSIRISFQIFLIGSLEAFLVVLFTSVLFSGVVLSTGITHNASLIRIISQLDLGFGTILLQEYNSEGFILQIGGLCSFGFFPELVLVWTGLSLFIGAFVQLIWQDHRITSPL